jgi:nucleotide-binding universal stress UspA family protein
MESEKKTILIPWDFSEVAEYALEHAIQVAKTVDNDVSLIHIIDEGGMFSSSSKQNKKMKDAIRKMEETAEETYEKHKIKPFVIVRKGSIFNTINEVAEEIEANLLIMGTHGIKGMQKLTGSWALKVIAGSIVPFVVVQAPPIKQGFNNIVCPIDFKKDNPEKLTWANYLSKYYQTKVHLLKTTTSDEFLQKKANANIIKAKRYLDSKEVDYQIETVPMEKDFEEEIVEYAEKIGADLILIMTTKNINLADYILAADEQYIIANKQKLPVMVINPRTDLTSVSNASYY